MINNTSKLVAIAYELGKKVSSLERKLEIAGMQKDISPSFRDTIAKKVTEAQEYSILLYDALPEPEDLPTEIENELFDAVNLADEYEIEVDLDKNFSV